MKLRLKLRDSLPEDDIERVREAAKAAGAKSVVRLFPKSSRPELAHYYTVEPGSDSDVDRILESLSKVPGVEFVERDVERSLKGS